MCTSDFLRRTCWVGIFALMGLYVGACDLPTSGPSFKTKTGLNTPVVVNKKFAFLGGPKSQFEPLVDTTTSQFDSLFTVSDSDQSLSIEEEVSSFDIGSLDQALDEATQGVGVNEKLSSTVLQDSDLATQTIKAGYSQKNGIFESDPVGAESPVKSSGTEDTVEVPFPVDSLATPPYGGKDASIQSVLLTSETSLSGSGTTVNQMTFTLKNDQTNPRTLTDGEGGAPVIEIQNANDDSLVAARFSDPVSPGESETASLTVAGRTLGDGTDLVLTISGSNLRDVRLDLSTTRFRYQETTLENVNTINVAGDTSNVSTSNSADAQFAGIEVRKGKLQLSITNNLSFPITVDELSLDNNPGSLDPLPSDFPSLDVKESVSDPIPKGATETVTVDLAGQGVANAVDVNLRIVSAQSGGTVTFSADGALGASVDGDLTVGTLYFWPDGEQFQTGGSFTFQTDRLQFEKRKDFIELKGGTLALKNFVSEPDLAFKRLTISFPDLRKASYAPGDSVSLQFVKNPSGKFEFSPIGVSDKSRNEEVGLGDLRLYPFQGRLEYHVKGILETISNTTASNLRVIKFQDEVRTDVSVGNLKVRALRGGVNPFSVNVTEDANGDGQLNLANTAEATQESFGGFGGIAESVNGLQLTGSQLKFQVTTDAGTDARLYAALQGRQGGTRTFLAGKGEKSVPPSAPLGDDFYAGNAQIARDNLIRFGIEGAPTDDPVTRSITLTGDNSTVNSFISTLPSSLRFVAQARLTGNDKNRIRLRRPLEFKAGLSVAVPVRVKGAFTLRDTIDADFSALNDVTDPSKDITISSAEFRIQYANEIPLGAEATLEVLDKNGTKVLTLPGGSKTLRLKPAPKARDGTASGTRTGKTVLDLSKDQLRSLAQGRSVRLLLTMDQAKKGGPATIRASDTIELSLRAEVKASVKVK